LYLLAAGAGAVINSRIDRRSASTESSRLLADVEAARIERLRQAAHYADRGGSGVVVPSDEIGREEALFVWRLPLSFKLRCCQSVQTVFPPARPHH
jgi:hypothetical protein